MPCHLHSPEGLSDAERFRALPVEERKRRLGALSPAQRRKLLRSWWFWARPKQILPPTWTMLWLFLGGRGTGKTLTATQTIKHLVEEQGYRHIAFVAPTAADNRDVQVEGPSGILSVYPAGQRPLYEPSKRRVTWSNGARATMFSDEAIERLRGPEHDLVWMDEPAAYRDLQHAWDLMMPGLRARPRSGAPPRVMLTTTPQPHQFFFDRLGEETTTYTTSATWENKANLPETTQAWLRNTYEGTDLGQQELEGKLLGHAPGALWRKEWLDAGRVDRIPCKVVRTIIVIDPSSSAKDSACEVGMVVMALGVDERGYVIADLSRRCTPAEWARAAIQARQDYGASAIVYEGNHGGGFIVEVFKLVDASSLRWLKGVVATVDKPRRATPIAALTQKGTIRMVGRHEKLEMQLISWVPGKGRSPDRLDAMVWGAHQFFTTLMPARGVVHLPGWG